MRGRLVLSRCLGQDQLPALSVLVPAPVRTVPHRSVWSPAWSVWSPDRSARSARFQAVFRSAPTVVRAGPRTGPPALPGRTGIVTEHAERVSAPGRLLYSVEEAADLLGIGRTFMFRLLATGEIDSFKIGKRRKVPRDALDGYIERLRSEQAAASGSPAELRMPKRPDGLRD
jgi:excisionase family DNA binding protein